MAIDASTLRADDIGKFPETATPPLPHTLAGAFASPAAAIEAATCLIECGFREADVSLLSRQPFDAGQREVEAIPAPEMGALAGTLAGGTLGVAAGIVGVALPGLGMIFVAGPLVGAAMGAIAGGLGGLLASAGVARDQADTFADSAERGTAIVAVRVEPAHADRAATLLKQCGALDVDEHVARWREAEPMPVAAIETAATRDEAERERRKYGTHAEALTGLPSSSDPEGDVLRSSTIRH